MWPQPAMSWRWRGASPANVGESAMSWSSVRIALSDRARFFRDVDAHRAPGDAAPAADAARAAELVDPRGELVRHPLAIAGAGRRPHRTPVDVRVVDGEAGVPTLPALDALTGEIGGVLHGGAEARRAH